MRLLAAFLLLLAPLAGCIQPPADETVEPADAGALPSADLRPPEDRIEGMTADEVQDDSSSGCGEGGISLPAGGWCAQRVVLVKGRIGLDVLPEVDLGGTNGGIRVESGAGDAWSFQATVRARGLTEDEARRALEEDWTWSHEDGRGGHHLKAGLVDRVTTLVGPQVVSTEYVVVLPAWVKLGEVRLEINNGDVALAGFSVDDLKAETNNGGVTVAGRVRDADLESNNGAVKATLLPTGSGSWSLETNNGPVHLVAAEHASRGYDLDAQTNNGRITIRLAQGTVSSEDENHKTFRTDGFERRAVQTEIRLETNNGDVTVVG